MGGRGGGFGAPAANAPNRSTGRFPDGADADSNCADFLTQATTTLPAAATAGATNIKVAGVADFRAGQSVLIDVGANAETAVIATVGTAGATTVATPTAAGATVIPVAGLAGFAAGQAITIDQGANAEPATVVSTAGGRGGGRGAAPNAITVTVAGPLKFAHAAGAQVSGTGLTLTTALARAHAAGAPLATSAPTPGARNQYDRPAGAR